MIPLSYALNPQRRKFNSIDTAKEKNEKARKEKDRKGWYRCYEQTSQRYHLILLLALSLKKEMKKRKGLKRSFDTAKSKKEKKRIERFDTDAMR